MEAICTLTNDETKPNHPFFCLSNAAFFSLAIGSSLFSSARATLRKLQCREYEYKNRKIWIENLTYNTIFSKGNCSSKVSSRFFSGVVRGVSWVTMSVRRGDEREKRMRERK